MKQKYAVLVFLMLIAASAVTSFSSYRATECLVLKDMSQALAFALDEQQSDVITADTIVYVDGQVLGKPHDKADARRMLQLISGRWHEVITGVTLMTARGERSFAVTTRVKFCNLTESEIESYVESGQPMDKAGAYGIQEWIGYVGVEAIEGSYFNVVGLPVQRLYRELTDFCNQ